MGRESAGNQRGITIPGRTLVFDYGEVISLSPSAADRLAIEQVAGVDPDVFWPSYWAHRDALDQGAISVVDYWAQLAADTGASWSASDVQSLWAADFRSWVSVDPNTVDILDELHRGGCRMALLSNAGFDFASPFRISPMARYFERVFISAEMDSVKPSPAIYREVADELGIELSEMVFVDNKQVNTDGAAALGVTVHHFTGAAGLREFMLSLAVTDD